jgi:hypothetical protein
MAETLKHTSKVLNNARGEMLVLDPNGIKIIVNAEVSKKIKQYIVDIGKVWIVRKQYL